MRKSAKVKLEEYMARKAEDRRERERIENSREMKPEQEGFLPERR